VWCGLKQGQHPFHCTQFGSLERLLGVEAKQLGWLVQQQPYILTTPTQKVGRLMLLGLTCWQLVCM